MYDFSWKDPLCWIAIVIPLIIFVSIVIGVWELLKWMFA